MEAHVERHEFFCNKKCSLNFKTKKLSLEFTPNT